MHYDPERITLFAKTDARGKEVPFGIKAKDRTKHVYVIGKTGMGKSTMLENMAIQDMQNGEGMAFIDPHGSTAEKLLDYIPEERIKDVLYFAPFDMEHPVSFNVMEDVGPDKRHLVVSGLMSTFKKIWVDAWSARMEYILSNTLLALLEYPGSTLLGVNRMLSDKAYREMVVANIKDPSVKSFWVDEFAKYNERYMQEAGDAIKNKIGQFTANPLIRNIIGQSKSSFDIRKMMDEKKILIMNLSKGLVGETNANLLGSMLITRIYLSAMSRADLPAAQMAKMPDFYFYVDEFQSFANETFANILSEARKYKLNLTIAHQYIEQMEEEVRNAVFGNVGTTIAFRVGPFDAEVLETVFAPQFTATDIVNLGFAQIYLTLMIDGIGSPPFSAATLAPIAPAEISHRDQIIAASREQYSHPRAEIEELITKWHEPIRKPESSGGKGGQQGKQERRSDSNAPRQEGRQDGRQEPRQEGRQDNRQEKKPQQKQDGGGQPPPNREREDPRREPRDAKPARHEKQDDVRPDMSSKNLSELRSVLQSIVTSTSSDDDEKKPREKNERKQHVRGDTQKGGGDGRADLREALKGIVGASKDAEKAKEPKILEATPPVTPPPAPPKKESPSGTSKKLTGKELEDMLRLSKHDRPPSSR